MKTSGHLAVRQKRRFPEYNKAARGSSLKLKLPFDCTKDGKLVQWVKNGKPAGIEGFAKYAEEHDLYNLEGAAKESLAKKAADRRARYDKMLAHGYIPARKRRNMRRTGNARKVSSPGGDEELNDINSTSNDETESPKGYGDSSYGEEDSSSSGNSSSSYSSTH